MLASSAFSGPHVPILPVVPDIPQPALRRQPILTVNTTSSRPACRDAPATRIPSRGEFDGPPDPIRYLLRRGSCLLRRRLQPSIGPASLRPLLGPNLHDPGLGTLLSLSVRVLPPKFLGQRVLSECRQLVLPLSARNANPGLQQAMAQLLPQSPPLSQRPPLHSRRVLIECSV